MRGTETDWGVIDHPRVQHAVKNAARSIADMNAGIVEFKDLYQEGLLLVASTPKIAGHANAGEYQLVYNEVRERLFKAFIRPMERSGELTARKYRNVSIEGSVTDPTPIPQMFDEGTGDYTEEAIMLLLPAVWDESYAYGLPDRADDPDEDMPKAVANKARSNNHWAYIADIKMGWEKTPLTLKERRALLMYYGLGYTQDDIARYEGIARPTATIRIHNGVTKITARLNGAGLIEEDEGTSV